MPAQAFESSPRTLPDGGWMGTTGTSPWGWPLVGPGQDGTIVATRGTAGGAMVVPLQSPLMRLAHAWALRDPALLRAPADRTDPAIVTERDVRARLRRLVPILVQGRELSPLFDGRQIVWSVPLYAASDRYPLSQRWAVGDGVYGYFRLGAVAFVEAQTGRVRLLPAAAPDPITRSWMRRFPELFARPDDIGQALLSQVPPAFERTQVQLQTFARYGSRLGTPVGRRLPETLLVGGRTPPPYLDRADSANGVVTLHWTVPLLNGADQLDGLITAFGGREPGTRWTPLPGPHPRWRAVLPDSQLVAGGDSLRGGVTAMVATIPHVLPTPRGVLVWERLRADTGAGPLIRAARVVDGRVVRRTGGSLRELAEAFGGTAAAASGSDAPLARTEPRSARIWYDRMQAAMQRGDWAAFGMAMDSLGRVLRRQDGGHSPP